VSVVIDRRTAKNVEIFKAPLIFSANMFAAFWIGVLGSLAFPAFFLWTVSDRRLLPNDKIILLGLIVSGLASLLVLIPGKLLAMWPYAIAVEPGKGIWVYAPAAKFWAPLDEIVDIDVYSGMYGSGHVVQLSRSHGLVKQLYVNSLFFPNEEVVHSLRRQIDSRDGVV